MRAAPGVRATGPLLSAASAETRAGLLARATMSSVPRGATILVQDATADRLLILLQGSIGLSTTEDGGAATMVEILAAGDAVSVAAVLLQVPHPVSAIALAPCRLLAIPAEEERPVEIDPRGPLRHQRRRRDAERGRQHAADHQRQSPRPRRLGQHQRLGQAA